MESRETAGTLLARTYELMRDNALAIAFTVILLVALQFIFENVPIASILLVSIAGFFAQYVIFTKALGKLGLMRSSASMAALPMMFGLMFFTNLATMIGIILLIVPGIILMVRWSIALPILLAEEIDIGQAISESWQRTAGRFWPIFGASAIAMAVAIIVTLVVALFITLLGTAGTVLLNTVYNLMIVALWYLSIAVYEHGQRSAELGEVFA